MRPEHLQHHRDAYSLSSEVVVAYSCGLNLGDVYPLAGRDFENPLNQRFVFHAPEPVVTIGASTSYDASALRGIRFRLGFEQLRLRGDWGLEPLTEDTRRQWGFETGEPYMANDAFMFMEMHYGFHVSNNQSVLCTDVTVDYLNGVEKPALLAKLYNSTPAARRF